MHTLIKYYGVVSRADIYELIADPNVKYEDTKYGWTDLKDVRILESGYIYALELPKANLIRPSTKGE